MMMMMACGYTTFSPPRLLPTLSPPPPFSAARRHTFSLLPNSTPFPLLSHHHNNNNNNNNGGGSGGGGAGWSNSSGGADEPNPNNDISGLLFIVSLFSAFAYFQFPSALAKTNSNIKNEIKNIIENGNGNEYGNGDGLEVVWEVSGGRWVRLVSDRLKDAFIVSQGNERNNGSEKNVSLVLVSDLWERCRGLAARLMLPEGFPESVTSDYLEYSLWRGVQGIAAQISGVLATQSLLYAVGLGKGAIPTAAAVNWVLKDGIGYISKIFLSKFGRHFDVNPKGWRLFADLLENAAFGMEILTPAFPHLFVPIGAIAGAGRSAAALIQAATRSCFYAGFAAQRNFAEVIAKGEAQGMVSKSIGIMLGIALANYIHTSTPLALATFGAVTCLHMFCNLKSYQAIQLRTLNPYRASLVFSEYLLSGLVPSVKEVNDEEPFFPAFPLPILSSGGKGQSEVLSSEAKVAAANIDCRLQLGSKLSDVVGSEDDTVALFDLYRNEGYILTEHEGRYCVILKESSLPKDMLKSLFHVNYLYWLEKNAGIKTRGPLHDCGSGGKLRISLEYVEREFNHVKSDGELTGWTTNSLIARPMPNRVRLGGDFALKV